MARGPEAQESPLAYQADPNRTNFPFAKVSLMKESEPKNPDGTYIMTEKRLKMMKKLEVALTDYKRVRERLEAEEQEK